MNRVRFVLKSGYSFVVTCKNVKINSVNNEMTGYSIEGRVGDRPLYIRIDDIAAVIDEGPVKEAAKDGA